ncbi:MAG: CXXX repeat peptide maturase [Clostridia bacterium]|nr:CXXX repeat peptide maturase [Clostridia bacterium]
MVQYLVILLDDTAVSFCHNENERTERRLIPLETLRQGILYGMTENLNIQFVYPDYELPQEYLEAIDTIDHTDIRPVSASRDADVVVSESADIAGVDRKSAYVLRLSKAELFAKADSVCALIGQVDRLNIVITDIETFTDADFKAYEACLKKLAEKVEEEYVKGNAPQLNLLTDRIMLDKMNNCGAGDTNITLAPDGKFYVCPAFYQSAGGYAVGSLTEGLDIKNPQLYKLDHAPLCCICDALQCRRCVWLNRKTTLEVNTPSHEQCVVAHLERNASRELLANIRKHGAFMPEIEIKKIDYLDPFDVREQW